MKPAPLKTTITEMFGMEYPIVAAPMFLVSNEEMVISASNAGGLGTFPALNYRPIENYKEVLKRLKSSSKGAFGVNIIVQKTNRYQDEHLEEALKAEVPLIITSLGNPKEVIERARGTRTKVFCDVVGLSHAKKVADYGADGLVVVGSGAGGHGGTNSLFALIPYLKKSVNLPMMAAGCISDGKGLLAALSLGADAVYMGTRFIASHEAKVQESYKRAITESGLEDIVNTDRVDGFPGNFIRTKNLEQILKPNLVDDVFGKNKKIKRWVSLARAAKALLGDTEEKLSYKNVFSAGQGVGSIDSIKSIEEIIWETVNQYRELKAKLP